MPTLCECPLFNDGDPYMAGLLVASLGIERKKCPGGKENELGIVVCNALITKQEDYAGMMQPIADAAEDFLRNNTDGVE